MPIATNFVGVAAPKSIRSARSAVDDTDGTGAGGDGGVHVDGRDDGNNGDDVRNEEE